MIWMPCSAPRLNSKILNFSNNHFGHLTSLVLFSEGQMTKSFFHCLEHPFGECKLSVFTVNCKKNLKNIASIYKSFHFRILRPGESTVTFWDVVAEW